MGRVGLSWVVSFFVTPFLGAHFSSAQNLTVTESFQNLSSKDTSSLVWNISRGELHPTLFVEGWNDGGGASNTAFSVGDGRHGAFISSRYTEFLGGNGFIDGNTIYLDTSHYGELQVTDFILDSGWTLTPIGNEPLVIRSLNNIQIEGVINCSGQSGADAVSDPTQTLQGGVGRCGGGQGGASVPQGVAPGATHQGQAGGTQVTGGQGGPMGNASGGQGGGGGGAYIKNNAGGGDKPDPQDGVNPAGGAGGAVGTIYRDDAFEDDLTGAGSGGGGGSAFNDAGTPGSHSSGASGGGGGGSILMYTVGEVNITATGALRVHGGNGGRALAPFFGGGGGGGGAGSILIFAGGDIEVNGPVSAQAGAGGTSDSGGNGGNGAWGRTWLVEKDGFASGGIVEDPETQLNQPGEVRFLTGTAQSAESRVIDTFNSRPTLLSSSIQVSDAGASTVTLEIAKCSGIESSTCEAYVASGTLEGTVLGRYFRLRVSLDNQSDTTPTRITSVALNFDGHKQNEFDFTGACARVDGGLGFPPLGLLVIFLMPLFLYAYARRLRHSFIS